MSQRWSSDRNVRTRPNSPWGRYDAAHDGNAVANAVALMAMSAIDAATRTPCCCRSVGLRAGDGAMNRAVGTRWVAPAVAATR